MINHRAVQLACRARLLSIVVCTTGSVTLSATATGYARTTGSFIADGFEPGMELTPTGFAANPVDVVLSVTALTLTTKTARATEVAAAGRTLSVGLPSQCAWENVGPFGPPTVGVPFIDEQYVRGPAALNTIGPNGRIIGEPTYLPRINVPSGLGMEAATRYADAMLAAFPPGDKIVLTSGDTIEVRAEQAPYSGQLLQVAPGFAGLLCTIPLRIQSINSI